MGGRHTHALMAGTGQLARQLEGLLRNPDPRAPSPDAADRHPDAPHPPRGWAPTSLLGRVGSSHRLVPLRRELVDGLRYLVGHRLLRTLALPLAAINAASSCVYAAAASLLRLTLNATGLTAPARRPVRPHPSLAPQVETASSPSSDHSVPGTLALTIRGVSAR